MKQRGLIEVNDLPTEIRGGGQQSSSPYLPVPMVDQTGIPLDIGLLISTLLELRQDIKEIKAQLRGGEPPRADTRIPLGTQVVETFAGEAGYSPVPGDEAGDLQTAERSLIEAALRAGGGNRRQAATRLGISERTLYRKIKQYGL